MPRKPSLSRGRGKQVQNGHALVVAKRRAEVWELYKQGQSLREIAPLFGVSHTTIAKDLRLALEELQEVKLVSADEWRQVHLERLQVMVKAVWPEMLKGNFEAVHALLKIQDQEAKLLGLNAPQKIDLELAIREMAEKEGLDPERAVGIAKTIAEEHRRRGGLPALPAGGGTSGSKSS